ncbi:hypothetical protein M9H77_00774 [Catharanthus roseus]|uniref:Uncharacterized protein n=1 Tax=Catharanthus roseus TaxID=4058 RepID=A0ACC0C3T2_CATRO|nr:hypothetical protein M9H77_00774 [Catharanthus roseus]
MEEAFLDNVAAARKLLRSSLEKSMDIASAINEIDPRLEKRSQRLASLQETIKIVASKCDLYDIRRHLDRAIGPAAAVLKIFEVVLQLQDSLILSDPALDLQGYLSIIQRTEEAAHLLTDNCKLVILWLQDALQFLQENAAAGDDRDWYLQNITKCLNILKHLQATEQRLILQGGLLTQAFDKLEDEFGQLLSEISFSSIDDLSIVSQTSFPLFMAENLHLIIERLTDSNRLENCLSIYVEVRSSIVTSTLQGQELNFLEISLSQFDSVQMVEGYIDQWEENLQFAVRYVFEMEYRLCCEMFKKAGFDDVWMDCFAKIVVQSGFCNFIKFGNTVCGCKKEAIKLLKLLDIFAALNRLRPEFNRLFSGKSCLEIQEQTRDLIKKVINGACEIFWELLIQVESQRSSTPPADASLSRLVLFVTEFCNLLLEDEYQSILAQVLEIHEGWNNRVLEGEEVVTGQVRDIINALELNLQTWAKSYGNDDTLSSLFLLNNSWYLGNNLKGKKLGEVMGENWLRGHEESMEYYAAVYLRGSWGKLPALLDEEDLTLYPGGRAINRELVEKRLQEFNKAFDDMYRKQTNWVFSDKELRLRMFQIVVQIIIPPYKNYIHKYASHAGDDGNDSDNYNKDKYISPESLEKMIGSLFRHKHGKFGSAKCTPLAAAAEISNAVPNYNPQLLLPDY